VENWWMTLWKTAAGSCGLRVVSHLRFSGIRLNGATPAAIAGVMPRVL
jgi:hypothetical protein